MRHVRSAAIALGVFSLMAVSFTVGRQAGLQQTVLDRERSLPPRAVPSAPSVQTWETSVKPQAPRLQEPTPSTPVVTTARPTSLLVSQAPSAPPMVDGNGCPQRALSEVLAQLKVASPHTRLASGGIPAQLHYTSRTDTLSPSWSTLNQGLATHYYSDEALDQLVAQHRPGLHRLFAQLRPVERADLFRYVALWALGGIYADVDVNALVPVAHWPSVFQFGESLADLDFILGVEFPDAQRKACPRALPFQLCQWTMAFAARSPLLDFVLAYCEQAVALVDDRIGADTKVLTRTGPLAWTEAIVAFLERYGLPPGNQGADTAFRPASIWDEDRLEASGQIVRYAVDGITYTGLILPYRAFGYHQFHRGRVRHYENHLVEHQVQRYPFRLRVCMTSITEFNEILLELRVDQLKNLLRSASGRTSGNRPELLVRCKDMFIVSPDRDRLLAVAKELLLARYPARGQLSPQSSTVPTPLYSEPGWHSQTPLPRTAPSPRGPAVVAAQRPGNGPTVITGPMRHAPPPRQTVDHVLAHARYMHPRPASYAQAAARATSLAAAPVSASRPQHPPAMVVPDMPFFPPHTFLIPIERMDRGEAVGGGSRSWSFTLTDEHVALLRNLPTSPTCAVEAPFRLVLRCLQLPADKHPNTEDQFCGNMRWSLPLGVVLDAQCTRRCPVDVTALVPLQASSSHQLLLSQLVPMPDTLSRFALGLYIAQHFTPTMLVERLHKHNTAPVSDCQQRVKQIVTPSDVDMCAVRTLVSLRCPLGMARINHPGRGTMCAHVQCFDLLVFLCMNERQALWKCPVCNRLLTFASLCVDGFFKEILDSAAVGVSEVEFDADGSWSVPVSTGTEVGSDASDSEEDSRATPLQRKRKNQSPAPPTRPSPSLRVQNTNLNAAGHQNVTLRPPADAQKFSGLSYLDLMAYCSVDTLLPYNQGSVAPVLPPLLPGLASAPNAFSAQTMPSVNRQLQLYAPGASRPNSLHEWPGHLLPAHVSKGSVLAPIVLD